MTAPLSSSYLSPIAGLVNALARHTIRGLDKRIRDLEALVADATELRYTLREARDFRETDDAGYIDRTGLEGP